MVIAEAAIARDKIVVCHDFLADYLYINIQRVAKRNDSKAVDVRKLLKSFRIEGY